MGVLGRTSAPGGGNGVTVQQDFGTSTTDVMSQNAMNTALRGNSVVLGTPTPAGQPTGLNGVSIGTLARGSNTGSVAIGQNAVASAFGSVAVGSDSQATELFEFSVGRPFASPIAALNRRVTNVATPTNPQDAATKEYVDRLGISDVPTWGLQDVQIQNGNVVLSQFPAIRHVWIGEFSVEPTDWSQMADQSGQPINAYFFNFSISDLDTDLNIFSFLKTELLFASVRIPNAVGGWDFDLEASSEYQSRITVSSFNQNWGGTPDNVINATFVGSTPPEQAVILTVHITFVDFPR